MVNNGRTFEDSEDEKEDNRVFRKLNITAIKDIKVKEPKELVAKLGLPLNLTSLEDLRKITDSLNLIRIELRNIIIFSTNGKGLPECRNWAIDINFDFHNLHSIFEQSKFEYALCPLDKYDPEGKYYKQSPIKRVRYRVYLSSPNTKGNFCAKHYLLRSKHRNNPVYCQFCASSHRLQQTRS